jgi:hypothetical protein
VEEVGGNNHTGTPPGRWNNINVRLTINGVAMNVQ